MGFTCRLHPPTSSSRSDEPSKSKYCKRTSVLLTATKGFEAFSCPIAAPDRKARIKLDKNCFHNPKWCPLCWQPPQRGRLILFASREFDISPVLLIHFVINRLNDFRKCFMTRQNKFCHGYQQTRIRFVLFL